MGNLSPTLAQNCNISYFIICSNVRFFFFLIHCGKMGQNRQTLVLVNFLKKFLFQIKGKFGSNLPQNYSTLYLMICHRFFLKHFSITEQNMQIKVTLASCPRNPLLVQLGNLGQNYATLCLKQLGLMICFLRSLKYSIMMGFNIQNKVMFLSLPKKSPST